MSATFLIRSCCCEPPTCDGVPCEFCADGTPISFTVTLEGIVISENEILMDTTCWRFAHISEANGTFCAEQIGDEPCRWVAGGVPAGVQDGGETCEFELDEIVYGTSIEIQRIDATTFLIFVSAIDANSNHHILFYATFSSAVCYLNGQVVNNELAEGDLAVVESDGYPFETGFAWNLGYGGTATITACCP